MVDVLGPTGSGTTILRGFEMEEVAACSVDTSPLDCSESLLLRSFLQGFEFRLSRETGSFDLIELSMVQIQ